MALLNFIELHQIAKQRGFKAIGSFNLHCLEMMPAFFKAAVRTNSPLMIQISTGTANYVGMKLLVDAMSSLSTSTQVPACLHLDHCSDIASIQAAIEAGFSSVMYDGSALPIDDNIANTQKVIAIAKPHNITVEAELGAIGGSEDGVAKKVEEAALTNPVDAQRFVHEADVDMLAVSIGTVHGSYTAKTNIRHDLLADIAAVTNKPLVLHGGTGVSEQDMRKVVAGAIEKVNVGTEMNVQWVRQCKDTFAAGKVNDSVRKFLIPANAAVEDVLVEKINLFK